MYPFCPYIWYCKNNSIYGAWACATCRYTIESIWATTPDYSLLLLLLLPICPSNLPIYSQHRRAEKRSQTPIPHYLLIFFFFFFSFTWRWRWLSSLPSWSCFSLPFPCLRPRWDPLHLYLNTLLDTVRKLTVFFFSCGSIRSAGHGRQWTWWSQQGKSFPSLVSLLLDIGVRNSIILDSFVVAAFSRTPCMRLLLFWSALLLGLKMGFGILLIHSLITYFPLRHFFEHLVVVVLLFWCALLLVCSEPIWTRERQYLP